MAKSINIVITVLLDKGDLILAGLAKLGYKVSLWTGNKIFYKTSNGPGGICIYAIEAKSGGDLPKIDDVFTQTKKIMHDNDIPYFSVIIFDNAGEAQANAGDLKPVKEDPQKAKKPDLKLVK